MSAVARAVGPRGPTPTSVRAGPAPTSQPRLTDRQLDVLELALRGLTNQQIGDRLYLSLDTVKTHFRRVYAQLVDERGQPATGAVHAVALALRSGALVYDPARRRLTRPPGRRPLPAYADHEAAGEADRAGPLPLVAQRSVQQRKADLGW